MKNGRQRESDQKKKGGQDVSPLDALFHGALPNTKWRRVSHYSRPVNVFVFASVRPSETIREASPRLILSCLSKPQTRFPRTSGHTDEDPYRRSERSSGASARARARR